MEGGVELSKGRHCLTLVGAFYPISTTRVKLCITLWFFTNFRPKNGICKLKIWKKMIGKRDANRRWFGKKTRVLHLKSCFFSVKTIFLPVNLWCIAGQRHVNWPLKAMILKLKVVGFPAHPTSSARKVLAISDMRKSLILDVFVTSGEVVCKFAKHGVMRCQEKSE